MNDRTILFDLDGTLTDPFEGITKSVVFGLEGLGKTAPACDELRWVIGPPLLKSLTELLDGDETAANECLRLYRTRFSTVGLFENVVYPGIPEVLAELKGKGGRLFVATSKPVVYADRIIEKFGLGSFFDKVFGSELDGTRTDKGELIGHLLESESIDPASCVMVGDRKHDVHGAHVNGVACIGAVYGYGSEDELVEARADVLVRSPDEIPSAVAGYWERDSGTSSHS